MRALALIPALTHFDWRLGDTLRRIGLPYLHVHGCSDLPRARSQLLDDALKTEAEVFLFIDADMAVTPDHVMQIVESEKLGADDAVSGCYLVAPGQLAAVLAEEGDIEIGGTERFVKLFLAGLGFAAVHRSMVERIEAALPSVQDASGKEWKPYCVPFVTELSASDGSEVRHYVSEDYSFWWRVKTVARAQLWLDTHLPVGHVKQTVLVPEGVVKPLGDDRFT